MAWLALRTNDGADPLSSSELAEFTFEGPDPATALWVAMGQPIVGKEKTVTARTNTHVVVSTKDLRTTDERARWIARAIAMAVNATP